MSVMMCSLGLLLADEIRMLSLGSALLMVDRSTGPETTRKDQRDRRREDEKVEFPFPETWEKRRL